MKNLLSKVIDFSRNVLIEYFKSFFNVSALTFTLFVVVSSVMIKNDRLNEMYKDNCGSNVEYCYFQLKNPVYVLAQTNSGRGLGNSKVVKAGCWADVCVTTPKKQVFKLNPIED